MVTGRDSVSVAFRPSKGAGKHKRQRRVHGGYSDVNVGAEISDEALILGKAVQEWRKKTRLVFPTFTELLEILKGLGYRKVS